ncbi:uncharacterized protein GGS25DRAFT_503840 [Hypoxylon fragiforme]|uniref:uncharacterized protein n=1 Tax=Hypoxylon fragiforme TaxID=63214 RepID=UPI0020C5DFC2|nr:uncharacterized protein GGS25DRAFT_503840 [Hypoxylon fragiforme]KAI2605141.1 hypothetical protein GGS25DRAFT_503840 [Hypoxylon fragiforme]
MSPIPDNDDDNHYDAGAPLDGGASPAILAGDDQHLAPSGLEIGIITGSVILVILSVIVVFVWRTRKSRNAKVADSASSATATAANEEIESRVTGTRGVFEPTPPPKDEMATTVKNDDLSSFEHSAPPSSERPAWNQWTALRRGDKREFVEEHEIATRT